MFLAQAMSADRACQNAVNDAAIKRMMEGVFAYWHSVTAK
jgi:hypothetical protein